MIDRETLTDLIEEAMDSVHDMGVTFRQYAEAAADRLAEFPVAVTVKPLEWFDRPQGQACRIGRCAEVSYSVSFENGRWGYRRGRAVGLTVSYRGGKPFQGENDAMDGAEKDHVRYAQSVITARPEQVVRDEALEEAAVAVLGSKCHPAVGPLDDNFNQGLDEAAAAIRAMKGGQ